MFRVSFVAILLCQIFFASAIFTEEDCLKDVEGEDFQCRALIPVFKWDHSEQKCVSAFYGGCNPTNNNFKSLEECRRFAEPICKQTLGDRIFEAEDCTRDVQQGMFRCFAYIPVYKWDQTELKCVKAIYGGCHGTNNKFPTEEECEKYAAPVCKNLNLLADRTFQAEDCNKEVEHGPVSCLALIPVYTWSQTEQKCVKATYGGCNATPNNFRTAEECQKYAEPICKKSLGDRAFQLEDCNKAVENGPIGCMAYIPVYTWSQKEQKCVKAIYGGCNASPNNFKSEDECQKYATPVCKQSLGERAFEAEDCDKGVQNGPVGCMASIPVYTWSQQEQRCVMAIYGGCNASPNNFKTEEECQKYAAPVCKQSLGEPAFQAEDCNKGVENGPVGCMAYIPVYTWSQKEQRCVKAIYGGCNASPNNFKTEEDCQKYAASVCKQTLGERAFQAEDCVKGVQSGPVGCMASFPVYTWSQKEQRCVKAIYGGCNASPNNFETEQKCQQYAAPVCRQSVGERTFQAEDCNKGVQNGPVGCMAYFPVYTWSQKEQICVKVIYGGCNASPNNFKTEEECQQYAAPVCKQSLGERAFQAEDCDKGVQNGPVGCMAYIPVYTWSQNEQKCVKAIYGGCNASPNNFKTEEECQKYAAPVCKKSLGEATFEFDDCTKEVEEGPVSCAAYIPVYKWDQKEMQCVQAIYGGCGATNNNFRTEEECQKRAAPVCMTILADRTFDVEDCNKNVEVGPRHCAAYIPVFKWDQTEQKCVRAIYGGCGATNNNFMSEDECQKYAAPICRGKNTGI